MLAGEAVEAAGPVALLDNVISPGVCGGMLGTCAAAAAAWGKLICSTAEAANAAALLDNVPSPGVQGGTLDTGDDVWAMLVGKTAEAADEAVLLAVV